MRENKIQKSFKAIQFKVECVCYDQSDHKSAECENVKSVSNCRKILNKKRLCFNHTGTKHRAADCRSNRKCLLCKYKHCTAICEKRSDETSEPMLASTESSVIYPKATIKVKSIKWRALLNSDSGSSYTSGATIDLLKYKSNQKRMSDYWDIN